MSSRRPAPSKPLTWIAYRVRGAKAALLGHVQATSMEEAVAMASVEFGVPAAWIVVQAISRH